MYLGILHTMHDHTHINCITGRPTIESIWTDRLTNLFPDFLYSHGENDKRNFLRRQRRQRRYL